MPNKQTRYRVAALLELHFHVCIVSLHVWMRVRAHKQHHYFRRQKTEPNRAIEENYARTNARTRAHARQNARAQAHA